MKDQAQRLAEERYPRVGKPDGSNDSIAILQDASRIGFIEGFNADRWIEVTPDTMPEESGWYVVWPEKWSNWSRLYFDFNTKSWSDNASEVQLHLLNCGIFYQKIEKPKQ